MAQKANGIAGTLKDGFWAVVDTVAVFGALYIWQVYFTSDGIFLTPEDAARLQTQYTTIGAILLGSMAVNVLIRGVSRRFHANVDDPDLPRDHLKTAFTKSVFKGGMLTVYALTLVAVRLLLKDEPLEWLLTAPVIVWQVPAALFVAMVGIEFVFSVIRIFGGRQRREKERKAPKSWLA